MLTRNINTVIMCTQATNNVPKYTKGGEYMNASEVMGKRDEIIEMSILLTEIKQVIPDFPALSLAYVRGAYDVLKSQEQSNDCQ